MIRCKVSVIICTKDRALLLRNCLKSLLRQDVIKKDTYEIIVVDNKSTDNTREIADSLSREFSNLTYLYEEKIGLSIARNTGIMRAKGEIICFIDDDVIVTKDFIYEINNAFNNYDIDVMAGRAIASWPNNEIPIWYSEKYANVVGQTAFGNKSRFMKKKEFPFGDNMSFRKKIFDMVSFNENLGKKGEDYIYGEEIDLCYKIKKMGYKFYYNSKALIYHVVVENRATKKFFIKSLFGKGLTEGYQKINHQGLSVFFIYLIIKIMFILFSSVKYVIAMTLSLSERKRFKLICSISYRIGYIYFLALENDLKQLRSS